MFFKELAGFRHDQSTNGQLYFSKLRIRVYCVFINFAKAFDSVSQKNMFFKLIDCVRGNLKVLICMHNKLQFIVEENGEY